MTTLISDVATTYCNLRELDLELEISQQTRDVAVQGLKLTTLRKNRGAATGLDLKQAEQLLYTATAQIAATERSIAQTENAMSRLLGRNPEEVPRGKALEDYKMPERVALGASGAAPRHPGSRADPDRRERPDRGRKGPIFSADFAHGFSRGTKQGVVRSV
jgi:multidrug efflux system outer membrane protein